MAILLHMLMCFNPRGRATGRGCPAKPFDPRLKSRWRYPGWPLSARSHWLPYYSRPPSIRPLPAAVLSSTPFYQATPRRLTLIC
ncbi:hypothetical protein F4859DRAFT_470247 [Xylaria cf. heliscus]|nr:hypothetical protein F4859DRAFT_470247 [Xylaria cf. heliscus]